VGGTVTDDAAIAAHERVTYPVFLVGGPCHGQAYLLGDRPNCLSAPYCDTPHTFEPYPSRPPTIKLNVAHYVKSEARVGAWDTPWIYYRHEALDEETGLFELWRFLWSIGQRFARAGGWERERACPRCAGTGVRT
jgi:hypothetical protein